VVKGVSDKVGKRSFEFVENVAVDTGLFTMDYKSNLFVKLARHISNKSGEAMNAVSERSHSAEYYFSV
jgi:hypothetical protein